MLSKFVILFTISLGREGIYTVTNFHYLWWEGGVQREIVPNSLYSWFFFDDFPYQISLYNELLYSNCVIEEVTINCQQFHELENSLRMPINELNNLAGSLRGLQKTHLEVVFEKKNHGKNLYCKRGY